MRIILLPILFALAPTHGFFISPNSNGRRPTTAFLLAASPRSLDSLTTTELKDLVKEQYSDSMGDKLKLRKLLRKLKQKQDLVDHLDSLGIKPKETETDDDEPETIVPPPAIAEKEPIAAEEETIVEIAQIVEQEDVIEKDTLDIGEEAIDEKDIVAEDTPEVVEDAVPAEPAAEEDTDAVSEEAEPPAIETKEPKVDQIAKTDSTQDMEGKDVEKEITLPTIETKELIADETIAAAEPTLPNSIENELFLDEKTAPVMKEEPTMIEDTPFVRYPPIAAKALEIIEEEPAVVVVEEKEESIVEPPTPTPVVEEVPIAKVEDTSEKEEPGDLEEEEAVEEEAQIVQEKPVVEETSLSLDEEESSDVDTTSTMPEEDISTPLAAADDDNDESKPFNKVHSVFPKALSNAELTNIVSETLRERHGYVKENTLLATSLCCDEVNRPLENNLCNVYGKNFNMGGLAGFPFGGATSFGAMAAHIPDGGSCLVVYGPHVGVDSTGKVGTVEREGRVNGGSCCGSAVAASGYANSVFKGEAEEATPPTDPLDAQQYFVGSMLLPHAKRLEDAEDKMVELPYALYDAQTELMGRIVEKSCGGVADGAIAVLGGIQINTPPGYTDYYLPLSFKLYDNGGKLVEDLLQS